MALLPSTRGGYGMLSPRTGWVEHVDATAAKRLREDAYCFYRPLPQRGVVYYDSRDLARIDVRSLRRNIGVVLQDGKLFAGSIYENIVTSVPSPPQDDAWRRPSSSAASSSRDARNKGGSRQGTSRIVEEIRAQSWAERPKDTKTRLCLALVLETPSRRLRWTAFSQLAKGWRRRLLGKSKTRAKHRRVLSGRRRSRPNRRGLPMTESHLINESNSQRLPREMLLAMRRAELMELGAIPDDATDDPATVPQSVLDYLGILPSEVGQ